jgi:hypothetical protein
LLLRRVEGLNRNIKLKVVGQDSNEIHYFLKLLKNQNHSV